MRVSVVICTLNRAASLAETLQCLTQQNYDNFEVVVVNGPSTDSTDEVASRWEGAIRYARCPVPNLSVSRNIGIRAAAGDVVAFIDDDALPEFDWLAQALPAFDDTEVAGVGGIVFDHTGLSLQYKYSAANRFGEATSRADRPYDDQCSPGTFEFPYLQGTNALFRRDALLRIGGFDETFEYYLDETDVCCRLIDAGYVLRQLSNAPVHHKFLPSSVRDHQRVVTNWWPIVKNQVYFSYRHALEASSEYEIFRRSLAFIDSRVADARFHEEAGRLPPGSASIATAKSTEAFRVGIQLGVERRWLQLGPVAWPRPDFHRFPTVDRSGRRKITMITSGYKPNMTGGIARFFGDLAPALARRGNEVRVITRAVGPAAIDLEDGVWVHRIDVPTQGAGGVVPDVLAHVNDFTTAAVGEIERIGEWSSHDVVYGPLWDVEVLGALRLTHLPVVVQVATPLAIAGDLAGQMQDPESTIAIERLMRLEKCVLEEADLFHANSSAVATTISTHYGDTIDPKRWQVVHLGLVDGTATVVAPIASPTDRGTAPAPARSVLFVGRFEVRKGIDTFLSTVEQVAPIYPDVHFIAAGEDRPLRPGEPPFGLQWRQTHRDAPWIDRVSFPGSVTDDELHRLYAHADVVVLPSRYESFGLVMVEAMMHGKPLISCDTSGIRDVVRNGVDGILVEPGDADALAASLRQLLDDPQRSQELATNGRQRYLQSFHIDRFAERFEDFLGRVELIEGPTIVEQPHDGTVVRSATGDDAVHLGPGVYRLTSPRSGSVARLVISGETASTVELAGESAGDPTRVEMSPGQLRRVEFTDGDGPVTLTVSAGQVVLHGLVIVHPQVDACV